MSEGTPVGTDQQTVPADELPATAWAVLGLLSFGSDLSGYDIKKWADASLHLFYWSPAISQIYSELKRLERQGCVTSTTVRQDDLRAKRVYAITPKGRSSLAQWVDEAPVEPPMLKHGVMLRVWLGHLADPARLRSIIEEHGEYAERMMGTVDRSVQTSRDEPAWAYPELVLRWCERYYRSERDLARALLADLDAHTGAQRDGNRPHRPD